jgi:hypothetical protein
METNAHRWFDRYRGFQSHVVWAVADLERVRGLLPLLAPHLTFLVEDFYAEIARRPGGYKVFTGAMLRSRALDTLDRLAKMSG